MNTALRFVRHFKVTMLLALFLFLSACQGKNAGVVLNEGDSAPRFSLMDLYGKTWSLEALQGRVVIVNFWAPWCPPCRAEMPSLQRLSYKMKNNSDLVILTVLYREEPQESIRFMLDNNLTLTVLLDTTLSVSKMYGVTGVPETYVIDKSGVLRRKIIGPTHFDTPDDLKYFTSLIGE
jgi:peroxiredoxin